MPGRSFKGQLYESTGARLVKERADRERFAKERNESAGGRTGALTFGMVSPGPSCEIAFYFLWMASGAGY